MCGIEMHGFWWEIENAVKRETDYENPELLKEKE